MSPGMVTVVLKRRLCAVTCNAAGFREGHFWWDGGICYCFVPWTWTLLELRLLQEGLLLQKKACLPEDMPKQTSSGVKQLA